jgi:hypothetical protein
MSENRAQANWISNFCSHIAARLAVILFLCFIFVLGCWVGGAGLHDPDTCWLLALGKYIYNHRAIPATDPFSFSLAMTGRTFVVYQWLSELVFYTCFKFAGLLGLLMLTASVLLIAFILRPLNLCLRSGAPFLWSLTLVVVGLSAACWHFLVRPEIFSYLFLSIWLGLLPDSLEEQKIDWDRILQMVAVMTVWANMHTGFVCGLLVLLVYIVVIILQGMIASVLKSSQSRSLLLAARTPTIAFVLSALATLFNPQGYRLWSYIPELFFSPINARIVELKPLTFDSFRDFTFLPFFLLLVIVVGFTLGVIGNVINRYKQENRRGNINTVLKSSLPFCCVINIIAILASFHARRIIPFAAIILVIETSRLWKLYSFDSEKLSNWFFGFVKSVEDRIEEIFPPSGPWWLATTLILTLTGVFLTASRVVIPTLPQTSKAFEFSFPAIHWLQTHYQRGRVFADAQYADCMIWYLKPVPSIFLDTRFDMYGDQLVRDYKTMRECSPGWRELINKYHIDSLFIPNNTQLAKTVCHDSDWQLLYSDSVASVYNKKL